EKPRSAYPSAQEEQPGSLSAQGLVASRCAIDPSRSPGSRRKSFPPSRQASATDWLRVKAATTRRYSSLSLSREFHCGALLLHSKTLERRLYRNRKSKGRVSSQRLTQALVWQKGVATHRRGKLGSIPGLRRWVREAGPNGRSCKNRRTPWRGPV